MNCQIEQLKTDESVLTWKSWSNVGTMSAMTPISSESSVGVSHQSCLIIIWFWIVKHFSCFSNASKKSTNTATTLWGLCFTTEILTSAVNGTLITVKVYHLRKTHLNGTWQKRVCPYLIFILCPPGTNCFGVFCDFFPNKLLCRGLIECLRKTLVHV